MDKIVIIGSSGHARVVIDIVEQAGHYQIVGLIDRFRPVGSQTLGYAVLGGEEVLPQLQVKHRLSGLIVAIGDNFIRGQVAAGVRARCPDLPLCSAIHPSAVIAPSATIGAGSVVMAGATVNPCCTVGELCILNTQSSLDHDSTLADCASLAPRATTGGNCHIGAYSAISIAATLIHGINIGEHSVVGAGAMVLKSLPAFSIAYGSPARLIRSRTAGEKYL